MAGSLDPEHILQWTQVCIGIVDFARNSDASGFRKQISKFLHPTPGSPYGGAEILEDLGLVKEATFFRAKADAYKKGDLKYFTGHKNTLFVPPM